MEVRSARYICAREISSRDPSEGSQGSQKLSEYLPSIKLDDYSFELHQERVDK